MVWHALEGHRLRRRLDWLAAWGPSLVAALAALQALATRRLAEQAEVDGFNVTWANKNTIQKHARMTGGEPRA